MFAGFAQFDDDSIADRDRSEDQRLDIWGKVSDFIDEFIRNVGFVAEIEVF